MKTLFTLLVTCCLSLVTIRPAFATVDPLSVPNNRFGIHILNEGDIDGAAGLVNSNGDWGYVTLVIEDNDRNHDKWQAIFDKLRQKHLIPIVRIATHGQGETWVKPVPDEAPAWASFLDSLNWVIKNRYVVIFNEPNHASEWNGTVAPSEYTDILSSYAQKLKEQNPDFFVLNAGFDASAPNSPSTMDEQAFLQGMLSHNPKVFENLDGWTSHSYPNPDFSSPPDKTGRGSVKTYLWETSVLKNLGIDKNLPIFITETGWSKQNLSENTVANYYQKAFQNAWSDPQIVAITPFVYNYQGQAFINFSWKTPQGHAAQYETVQALEKTKGDPEQVQKLVLTDGLPKNLITNSTYLVPVKIKNEGQSIWDDKEGYYLASEGQGIQASVFPTPIQKIKPFGEYQLALGIKTPSDPGQYTIKISLVKNGQVLGESVVSTVNVLNPEVKGAKTKKEVKENFFQKILHPLDFLSYLRHLTDTKENGIL